MPPNTIPGDFGPQFLAWLKQATEDGWRRWRTQTLEDFERSGVGGCSWQRDTHWTGGLSDGELADVEGRFGVRFPADHRLFLQTLHATTPLQSCAFFAGDKLQAAERPGFYHWQRDEAAIRFASEAVVSGLVFDVEHNALWPGSWGPRPASEAERSARVAELVEAAPRLLPITGHRHVLADGPTIVLSVHQSDIIVYGRDLRAYLLNELHGLLGIDAEVSWTDADTREIPFWGELIG